jgi:hypothetical protein
MPRSTSTSYIESKHFVTNRRPSTSRKIAWSNHFSHKQNFRQKHSHLDYTHPHPHTHTHTHTSTIAATCFSKMIVAQISPPLHSAVNLNDLFCKEFNTLNVNLALLFSTFTTISRKIITTIDRSIQLSHWFCITIRLKHECVKSSRTTMTKCDFKIMKLFNDMETSKNHAVHLCTILCYFF